MATKSDATDLPELLVKVEEDLQVSQNGVKAIETLKTFKFVQHLNNPRYKVLLDNSVKLISEEQETLEGILTIGTLYYYQLDYKTSIRWFLKYFLKKFIVERESKGEGESESKLSYEVEFQLGCCYYNLNNYKMAYKCLKKCPPDPTNVSRYLKHCDMLIHSCQVLELHDEMLKYQGLCDVNPSGILNVELRIFNAENLLQFGFITGAIQHLKEASNILCNCQDKQMVWLRIAGIYTDLKMFREACQCEQKIVDSFKDQSLDPPPDILLKVLIKMSQDQTCLEQYQTAISISQHFLELVLKAPHYDKHVVLFTMAQSYYWLNDFGSAIKYFKESMKMKRVRTLDYSRVWLRISRSQLLSGSYQMALKSAKKSAKCLKSSPGKFPNNDIETTVQLSYCWRKLGNLQKAKKFMNSAMELDAMKEDVDLNSKDYQLRLLYIGVCEHLISGTFAITDNMFKLILLEEAEDSNYCLEEVMIMLHFCCVKSGRNRRYRSEFPEDAQLFWSRINHICCNEADDGYFLSQLPNGFKKRFFQYKNSLEGCHHLLKQSIYTP
jgi:tetratricopeptide (TPR) repeat protein